MGFHSDLGLLKHQIEDRNKRNPAKYQPGDRVKTPEGAGVVIEQTKNLYLMRPGAAYSVKLDNGKAADYNENDLK